MASTEIRVPPSIPILLIMDTEKVLQDCIRTKSKSSSILATLLPNITEQIFTRLEAECADQGTIAKRRILDTIIDNPEKRTEIEAAIALLTSPHCPAKEFGDRSGPSTSILFRIADTSVFQCEIQNPIGYRYGFEWAPGVELSRMLKLKRAARVQGREVSSVLPKWRIAYVSLCSDPLEDKSKDGWESYGGMVASAAKKGYRLPSSAPPAGKPKGRSSIGVCQVVKTLLLMCCTNSLSFP